MRFVLVSLLLLSTAVIVRADQVITASGPPLVVHTDVIGACPADAPRARAILGRLLTHAAWDSARTEIGLANVDTATIRVLSDSTDLARCTWYGQNIELPQNAPRSAVYYEAGGRFFVVSYITSRYTGYSPTLVLDSANVLLKGFLM